ncbi:flavin reductase family protein [Sphingobium algorifonticola]|nr:flavin reductase family protein [Sphingobium algorifonticola]
MKRPARLSGGNDAMRFDIPAMKPADRYKILASAITPRPIAWVTSQSAAGGRNAAPYSFFNFFGPDPATIVLGLMARPDGTLKDSDANILETGEFVVNLVCEADAQAMNLTCIDAPPDVDEITLAKLEVVASDRVAPPRIVTAPASFECRLLHRLTLSAAQTLMVAEVVMAHVADAYVLDEQRCHIDTGAMHLIARVHGAGVYLRSGDTFQMDRPVWKDVAGNPGK